MKTFSIHTLGCKVNTYESDMMAEAMRKAGFIEIAFPAPSDICIINTCTVTNIADRKSRQMLRKARKQNPDMLIIATGCYIEDAKMNGKLCELIEDRVIDIAVGNREKHNIVSIVNEKLNNDSKKIGGDENIIHAESENCINNTNEINSEEKPSYIHDYTQEHFVTELDGHTRAFIKIQDGCNMFCSYCVIPYVRGRGQLWFRETDDIVNEVTALAQSGVSEVVLTGIHMSSMKDRLADIIETVAKIEGIKRIRLGSLEPMLMTEEFVKRLKKTEKLCPHFHLSLQSGSDTVLKRMNRHYTADEYAKSCSIIKKYYDHPSITTDIIVGFPGETEKEFNETVELCRKVGFYEAHVFKYSRRSGTVADKMPEQLTEAIKEQRSEKLIQVTEELSHEFRKSFIGKKLEFLSEELITINGETYETGYTDNYIKCIKKSDTLHCNSIISGTVLEILKENDIDDAAVLI